MSINWDNVSTEQTGYEPLPEGNYDLFVEKCEEDITKNGNTCFNFTFIVEGKKRKVFDTLYLTEKALNRFKKASSCLNVELKGEYQPKAEDYIGKQCNASLIITSYIDKNGQTKQKNEINWWNSQKKEDKIIGTDEIPF